ncbi:hypothetical protein LINGRAHAP2_LOCUS11774, partial [Linum grandiflorum]
SKHLLCEDWRVVMARREPSESEESKSNDEVSSEEEEEEEEKTGNHGGNHEEKEEAVMPDYERQRLERMAANRARMEALGLPTLASSLMSPAVRRSKSAQRKGKRKSVDDEDYVPDQDEAAADDDDDDLEQAQDIDEDDDGDFVARRSSSKPRKNKNHNILMASTSKGVYGMLDVNGKTWINFGLDEDVYMYINQSGISNQYGLVLPEEDSPFTTNREKGGRECPPQNTSPPSPFSGALWAVEIHRLQLHTIHSSSPSGNCLSGPSQLSGSNPI